MRVILENRVLLQIANLAPRAQPRTIAAELFATRWPGVTLLARAADLMMDATLSCLGRDTFCQRYFPNESTAR
jgi:hypothetical protein